MMGGPARIVPALVNDPACSHENRADAARRLLERLDVHSQLYLPVRRPTPPLKALPIDMGLKLPIALYTLKNRTVSPAVKLFTETAREVAAIRSTSVAVRGKPLANRSAATILSAERVEDSRR